MYFIQFLNGFESHKENYDIQITWDDPPTYKNSTSALDVLSKDLKFNLEHKVQSGAA
jgi:hypothetical protein